MPEYTRTAVAADEQQASKSPLSSLVRWLQIKKYQYEVTFSLYMLTPTEKCVFSTWPAFHILPILLDPPPCCPRAYPSLYPPFLFILIHTHR